MDHSCLTVYHFATKFVRALHGSFISFAPITANYFCCQVLCFLCPKIPIWSWCQFAVLLSSCRMCGKRHGFSCRWFWVKMGAWSFLMPYLSMVKASAGYLFYLCCRLIVCMLWLFILHVTFCCSPSRLSHKSIYMQLFVGLMRLLSGSILAELKHSTWVGWPLYSHWSTCSTTLPPMFSNLENRGNYGWSDNDDNSSQ